LALTEVVAFIFARGGSKGLPGKNIRPLMGKPLIGHAIEHAQAVARISRIIVSTDCADIAGVAREFGAEVPFMRPAELARDDSPEWLAWQHALKFVRQSTGTLPDAMVSVPTTAPLRLPADIEACLDVFQEGGADVVVTVTPAHRSPYFNMVKQERNGFVSLVIAPEATVSRRQDVPPVYDMATVAYVCDPHFVLASGRLFDGRVRSVVLPQERATDIDTLADFEWAEWLMARRQAKHR
jgi:CMP-N-acetylneuraminic acid synthetase